jgi:hypothetical protein
MSRGSASVAVRARGNRRPPACSGADAAGTAGSGLARRRPARQRGAARPAERHGYPCRAQAGTASTEVRARRHPFRAICNEPGDQRRRQQRRSSPHIARPSHLRARDHRRRSTRDDGTVIDLSRRRQSLRR